MSAGVWRSVEQRIAPGSQILLLGEDFGEGNWLQQQDENDDAAMRARDFAGDLDAFPATKLNVAAKLGSQRRNAAIRDRVSNAPLRAFHDLVRAATDFQGRALDERVGHSIVSSS